MSASWSSGRRLRSEIFESPSCRARRRVMASAYVSLKPSDLDMPMPLLCSKSRIVFSSLAFWPAKISALIVPVYSG